MNKVQCRRPDPFAVPFILSVCLLWLFWFSGSSCLAEENAFPKSSLSLYVENDVIANTDREYTSGLKISWASVLDPGSDSSLVRRKTSALVSNLPFMADDQDRHGITLSMGHNIYTPEDTMTTEALKDQRPYAGIAYAGFGFYAVRPSRLIAWEFNLGWVGPLAMGEEVQNTFHDLINTRTAKGWDNQLDNELILQINLDTKRRFWHWQWPSGLGLSLIGQAGAGVGNAAIFSHGGAELRLGWRLLDDFGSCPIKPGCDINTFNMPNDWMEPQRTAFAAHLFLYSDVQFVLHDLTLDGNFGQWGQWVDREPFVGDIMIGLTIQINKLRVSYAHVLRTQQYREQDGAQVFGTLILSYFF